MAKRKIQKKQKRVYGDGYVEFATEQDAQTAEDLFNGRPILGKKGYQFYGDFISLKYQPGLQWQELLERKMIKK